MANKNLKVALQVQADLNQAKREIGSLKAEIKDTSKVADAATASQAKTSKAVAVTADEVKKLSGATNLKDGVKQLSDYENWLSKTSIASKNVADSNSLIEKSITSLTPHLTALIGLSGGFIAVAVLFLVCEMFGLTCDQLLVVEVVDLHGAFHVGERFGGDALHLGGAVHVRPDRPRPAVWWSATSTAPSAAPSRASGARAACSPSASRSACAHRAYGTTPLGFSIDEEG